MAARAIELPPEADSAHTGRVLGLDHQRCVVPEGCACCGEVAATSTKAVHRSQELIVPYCDRCLRHASAGTTRALAATLASILVAITLALGSPVVWPHAGLLPQVALIVSSSCLPLFARLWRPKLRSPHTASEHAAWWLGDGTLACTNARWAEELARRSQVSRITPAVLDSPRWAPWLIAGPLIALLAGASGWFLHHPLLRVVNLSEARLVVSVDGRTVATLEPTSSESPAAGVEIRIPAGERHLVADGPGARVSDVSVSVESGAVHLYAPASEQHCFWLEENAYGRAEATAQIVPLLGQERFWVLPRRIDTWFAPNPPPASDRRSSGGSLVALRQARCEHAPATARP